MRTASELRQTEGEAERGVGQERKPTGVWDVKERCGGSSHSFVSWQGRALSSRNLPGCSGTVQKEIEARGNVFLDGQRLLTYVHMCDRTSPNQG